MSCLHFYMHISYVSQSYVTVWIRKRFPCRIWIVPTLPALLEGYFWCSIVNLARGYSLFKSNSSCSDFNMFVSYACQIYGPVGHSTLIIRVGIRCLWPKIIMQKCSFLKLTFFVIEPFLLELYLMFQFLWKHNLFFWLSKTLRTYKMVLT